MTVLREVALRGSFSAAAESLDYTQPAVSQQIARLEKQVGVKLIERQVDFLRRLVDDLLDVGRISAGKTLGAPGPRTRQDLPS